MNRSFTNILCDDPAAVAPFYEGLLNMRRSFDADWFILLEGPEGGHELGLLSRDHDTVPDGAGQPGGAILTFVVSDCEVAHARALDLGLTIQQPPHDTPYGQRRMILRDPAGMLVDISAPTAPMR